jgi:sugar phosphate isomerase/epimerase
MDVLFFCPRWGSESLPPAQFIQRVLDAGFDGVEVGLADEDPGAEQVLAEAKAAGLRIITQHTVTQDPDPGTHLAQYERRLRRAAGFNPVFVNSHTGRDRFGLADNVRLFEMAQRVSRETGVPVYHETHRSRCCHSPWRTVELLRALPETRLVLDLSHWCCVCESLLEDQADFLEEVLPAVEHVHARVGWEHGPQVNDPRAPEWAPALAAHLRWWDALADLQRAAGRTSLTITPEFGPPPYLPTLPYTRQPVVSQWAANLHMRELLRARYQGEPGGA